MTPPIRPILVTAAVVLVAACATTGPDKKTPPPSQLLVSNGSTTPCDLYVQGDYVASVPAATAVVLSNLPGTRYTVAAFCGSQELERQVDPAGLARLDIPGDAAAVEERTATLIAHNPSPFDVELEMDGTRLGRVFAESTAVFPNLVTGDKELVFREMVARGDWTRSVTLYTGKVTRVDVQVPQVSLAVNNDSSERVRLALKGKEAVEVKPGEQAVLDGLPPGTSILSVEYVDSGRHIETPVEIAPGEKHTLELSAQAGTVRVVNKLSCPASVFLNKELVKKVEPDQELEIPGVLPGKADVRVAADTGALFQRQFVVVPGSIQSWVLSEEKGEIAVTNAVGEKIVLLLDGHRVLEMSAGETARFFASQGAHHLSARCKVTAFQQEAQLMVEGGVINPLVFGPQPGRIFVENRLKQPVDLFRNSRALGRLMPDQALEFGGQPLGNNLLEVLSDEGKVLLRKELSMTPEAPLARPLVLTESNASITVVIKNETGEPVKLAPTVIAEQQIIETGQELEVALLGEAGELKMVGANSGTRYDKVVRAAPGESARIVLTPSVGGIAVSNSTGKLLEVLLDDAPFALLEPDENHVVENVGPGKHILKALVQGKEISQTSCILVKDSWFMWKVAQREVVLRVVNRAGEDLALAINGEPAGNLPSGSDTVLNRLPPGPLVISATGLKSLSEYRFVRNQPPEEEISWTVRPSSGGVRLWGLGGLKTLVYVNGALTRTVEAGASEPVYVPLDPGEHAIRVVLEDGTTVAALITAHTNLYAQMHVKDAAPSVEARNRSGATVLVWVDGRRVDSVADGEDRIFPLDSPGVHTVRAVRTGTGQEWRLSEIYFKETGRFGWTLSPVDRGKGESDLLP